MFDARGKVSLRLRITDLVTLRTKLRTGDVKPMSLVRPLFVRLVRIFQILTTATINIAVPQGSRAVSNVNWGGDEKEAEKSLNVD
ncbi:hypothetical protein VPR01S_13_00060 [Vibrio proteolyticus NBRC 13287]|uniref:Uncharacterized protein n=1 Tax=Vibrio proteolyticus NBRC 13287 TaxID=1219065 RepID=U3A4V0_VIBPR|nr:hypothetical protein VPR01S_13_00060 [Vibrio proteolyticus NBRC 13287]